VPGYFGDVVGTLAKKLLDYEIESMGGHRRNDFPENMIGMRTLCSFIDMPPQFCDQRAGARQSFSVDCVLDIAAALCILGKFPHTALNSRPA